MGHDFEEDLHNNQLFLPDLNLAELDMGVNADLNDNVGQENENALAAVQQGPVSLELGSYMHDSSESSESSVHLEQDLPQVVLALQAPQ
jgi:hypothetical protein